MKRMFAWGLVCWAGIFSLASAAFGEVKFINVSVSPQILLQIYSAVEKSGVLVWPNDQILMMALKSDGQAEEFTFRVEIRHGSDLVASAHPFRVRNVAAGMNTFPAAQILTNDLTFAFNTDYAPVKPGEELSLNTMPSGRYTMVLTPISPGGPAYMVQLPLFSSPSALNAPPLAIYPKETQVNTLVPTFTWTLVQQAKEYEVLVGPDQDPGVNTYWTSSRVTGNQVIYPSSARTLEPGKRYSWQVRAYDVFGKPIGGVNGQSQPTWFMIASDTRLTSAVTAAEVDQVFRAVLADRVAFDAFEGYAAVAVETTSPDLAGLLQQLREGSLRVLSVDVE